VKSLRQRLWLICTLVLALSFAIFGTLVWLLVSQSLSGDADLLVKSNAGLLSRLTNPPVPRIEPWIQEWLELDKTGVFVQLFDSEGKFIEKTGSQPVLPLSDSARGPDNARGGLRVETIRDDAGREVRVATSPRRERWQGPILYYAQACLPLDAMRSRLHRLTAWLIGGGLSVIVLGSLAARVTIGQWLRSLAGIEEAARKIGAQNLGRRRLFAPEDDVELAALARTFNELLDRLDAAHATQQRFVGDASHELRTPLTIVLGEIDVALRRERAPAEYREVLESNREEIARLSHMVDNLLALARADAGEGLARRAPLDVHTLCGDVCDKFARIAEKAGVALILGPVPEPPAIVHGDAVALERVVFNLVENALAHTPSGETVRVEVRRAADGMGGIEIIVSDTGCGIAKENLPHLFERFYSVDKARSREAGGAGLGLSIVHALVEAHGGRVAVSSTLGQGCTFTVWLPEMRKSDAG
jgi:heavy metal sensor kinase